VTGKKTKNSLKSVRHVLSNNLARKNRRDAHENKNEKRRNRANQNVGVGLHIVAHHHYCSSLRTEKATHKKRRALSIISTDSFVRWQDLGGGRRFCWPFLSQPS
jgi:hypothetical protein